MTLAYTFIFYQKVRRKRIIMIIRDHCSGGTLDNLTLDRRNIFSQIEGEQEQIFHLNATLVLYGDEDIPPTDIYHPITLKFEGTNTEVLQHRIDGHTFLLNCKSKTNNNSIEFITDILKSEDFINFSVVYKSKSSKFSVFHRILNLNKKIKLIDHRVLNHNWLMVIISLSSVLFFIGILVAITGNDIFNFTKIRGAGRLLYPLLLNSTLLIVINLFDLFQFYKFKKF